MKLGLVTDIHEHVDFLRVALRRFEAEGVDQVVVIGDLFLVGKQIEETCRLLADVNTVGVWGNHDYGLCVEPDDDIVSKYGEEVIAFTTTLQPRMTLGDCHFTHIEPWLDPESIADLWYFQGPPDEHGRLDRIFAAVPDRLLFMGHYHKWLLATEEGVVSWAGDSPVHLDNGRYFIVVGPLCSGQYAIFDTETSQLIPFDDSGNGSPGRE